MSKEDLTDLKNETVNKQDTEESLDSELNEDDGSLEGLKEDESSKNEKEDSENNNS